MKTKFVFICLLWLSVGCSTGTGPSDTNVPDIPGVDMAQDQGQPPDISYEDTRDAGQDTFDAAQDDTAVQTDENPADTGNPTDDGTPDVIPDVVDNGGEVSIPRGKLTVIPYFIDFGYVPLGATSTVPIAFKNDGDAALRLDKVTTNGPLSIKMDIGFEPEVAGSKTTYTISPPKVLKPGARFEGHVVFEPTSSDEAYSEIKVYTSDAEFPDGYLVHAMGNRSKPCLEIIPSSIDFGPEVIGSPITRNVLLKSCGAMAVTLKGVYVDGPGVQAGFKIEFAGAQPTVQNPVSLEPLETLAIRVVYDPATASPVDEIGMPITQNGQIVVSGDMFSGTQYLRVSGFAVEGACTRPIIQIMNDYMVPGDGCPVDRGLPAETLNTRICRTDDGFEVPTGTLISLSGVNSFSPFGALTGYSWTVNQPANNGGYFIPDPTEPETTFMVGEGGTYELFLDVTDADGHTTCEPTSVKITTRTEIKADILLSWKPVNPFTPTPPFMGPDLDLHYTHPFAGKDGTECDCDSNGSPDNWFDLPYDCFWFNPSPAKDLWGDALPWTNDLVRLRNDSDDGSAPEVLTMGLDCAAGRAFTVGVYFFDDHDYGPVDATVQVFIKGVQAFTKTVRLSSLDMWNVGNLTCRTTGLLKWADFTEKTTGVITHNYINTTFVNP